MFHPFPMPLLFLIHSSLMVSTRRSGSAAGRSPRWTKTSRGTANSTLSKLPSARGLVRTARHPINASCREPKVGMQRRHDRPPQSDLGLQSEDSACTGEISHSDLVKVHEALRLTSTPRELPCVEENYESIRAYLLQAICCNRGDTLCKLFLRAQRN